MFRKLICIVVLALVCAASDGLAADWPSSARSRAAIADITPTLSQELANQGFALGDHVFLRLVKSPAPNGAPSGGYLEIYIENTAGRYVRFKTYPVCKASGRLGPKTKQGDQQAPEGFYYITKQRLNPNSTYHLSMNMGYPNAYDRAHGYTGDYLMIHGECVSVGCFAMTNDGIDEIYTLVDAALRGGQGVVRVHSFPFPMSDDFLSAAAASPHFPFWENLKTGWDWFETKQTPPDVVVKNEQYHFQNLPN